MQIGARAEAFFGFDALSVEGYFGFDALLRFSPFYLIVEISTGFSVKVFGVGRVGRPPARLARRARRRGTSRARPRSRSCSSSSRVDVDETFGERRAETAAADRGAAARCKAEFEKLESWRATLPGVGPPARQPARARRRRPAGAAPGRGRCRSASGSCRSTSRSTRSATRSRRTSPRRRSAVDAGGVLAVRGPMRRTFAAAQYRDMDDAAKLSAPAFEPFESGVELGAAGQRLGHRAVGARATSATRRSSSTPRFERVARSRSSSSGDGLFVHFGAGAAVAQVGALAGDREAARSRSRPRSTVDRRRLRRRQPGRQHARSAARRPSRSHAEATAHLADAVARRPDARRHDPRDPGRGGERGGMSDAADRRRTRSCRGPARGWAARCRRPTRRAVAGIRAHDRRDAARSTPTRSAAARRPSRCPQTSSCTGRATSSASTRQRSCAREPRHWITNFETNYLPFVEFYEEDFPWRYTPASHSDGGRRLRPWLTLVVLDEGEFARPRRRCSGGRCRSSRSPTRPARSRPATRCGRGPTSTSTARSAATPTTTPRNAARLGADRRAPTATRPTRGCCARASSSRTPRTTRSSSRRSRPDGSPASARTPHGAAFPTQSAWVGRPSRPDPDALSRLPPLVLPHRRRSATSSTWCGCSSRAPSTPGSAGATSTCCDPGAESAGDHRARRHPAPGRRAARAAQHAERRRARRVRAVREVGGAVPARRSRRASPALVNLAADYAEPGRRRRQRRRPASPVVEARRGPAHRAAALRTLARPGVSGWTPADADPDAAALGGRAQPRPPAPGRRRARHRASCRRTRKTTWRPPGSRSARCSRATRGSASARWRC